MFLTYHEIMFHNSYIRVMLCSKVNTIPNNEQTCYHGMSVSIGNDFPYKLLLFQGCLLTIALSLGKTSYKLIG